MAESGRWRARRATLAYVQGVARRARNLPREAAQGEASPRAGVRVQILTVIRGSAEGFVLPTAATCFSSNTVHGTKCAWRGSNDYAILA